MKGYIDGVDFVELEPMKYWSFTATTSDETRRETVKNAVFSGDYIGSLKVDGFYQRLIKDEDGNCFMIARSRNVKGEVVDKYEWVPQIHKFMEEFPNGTCFLAEAYLPGNEGSKNVTSILGCLKDKAIARQKTTPLHFHIFDVMAFAQTSYLNVHYSDRAELLTQIAEGWNNPFIHFTQFFEGAALWDKLQEYLSDGREGMVIMRKDAIVYQKRTPARVSIKVKKELHDTIDCFFTGNVLPPTKLYTGKEIGTWQYWQDERTGEKLQGELYNEYFKGRAIVPVTKSYFLGLAGSLEIAVFEGQVNLDKMEIAKITPIGYLSGLTEEIKANPKKYAFKPIEVTAMEVDTESHSLRHGKFLQFRDDINLSDCTLDKFLLNH